MSEIIKNITQSFHPKNKNFEYVMYGIGVVLFTVVVLFFYDGSEDKKNKDFETSTIRGKEIDEPGSASEAIKKKQEIAMKKKKNSNYSLLELDIGVEETKSNGSSKEEKIDSVLTAMQSKGGSLGDILGEDKTDKPQRQDYTQPNYYNYNQGSVPKKNSPTKRRSSRSTGQAEKTHADVDSEPQPVRNRFYSVVEEGVEQNNGSTTVKIPVAVQNQTEVVTGQRIELRILEDTEINGTMLRRNTFLFGQATTSGNRILVSVTSIPSAFGEVRGPFQIYDASDNNKGLYVPPQTKEASSAKRVGTGVVNELSRRLPGVSSGVTEYGEERIEAKDYIVRSEHEGYLVLNKNR